jgi:possible phosphinothricin acetyltransferase
VGTFHRCGYKFDTWYDVVWMEKRLSDAAIPPAVVPFSSFVK